MFIEFGQKDNMAKLIKTDDGYFRIRRGKLVRIPDEWLLNVTHPQTINKRLSKQTRKQRLKRDTSYTEKGHPRNYSPRHYKFKHLEEDE